MNRKLFSSLLAAGLACASVPAAAEIILYNQENFNGRSVTATRSYSDLRKQRFNDRASSAIVYRERWEVCEDVSYGGRCTVLRPGRYPDLRAMGVGNSVSSVRAVVRQARIDDNRYAPPPYPVYDSRPRKDERLFQADVTAVRAVYGRPEQRCWVEREQVTDRSNQIGGAALGAILGGVLGHQVGSGRGNDVATAIGVIAGGAIGANVAKDKNGQPVYSQDVRKCASAPGSGRPEYWDVAYRFRGNDYRMQTAYPPGQTVTVNRRGEPRG